MADFLVEVETILVKDVLHTETWMIHVDSSSIATKGGAGIFLQGPNNIKREVALRLDFEVTNNEARYEALITGMKLTQQMKLEKLVTYTNSQLVAMQFEGSYEAKEKKMIEYLNRDKQLVNGFKDFKLCQIPRDENERADTLSKFASIVVGVKDRKIIMITLDQPEISLAIDNDPKPLRVFDLVAQVETNNDWRKKSLNFFLESM